VSEWVSEWVCVCVCVCVCGLSCRAGRAHALYYVGHLWPVWFYHIFPHCLINGMVFWKTLLSIKYVFWFPVQRLPETFLILRRRFWWNLNSLDRFFKMSQISDFIKIRAVGAKLFHRTAGRMDMIVIVAFRNFAKAPKKGWYLQMRKSGVAFLTYWQQSVLQVMRKTGQLVSY
jgi:hypothetical protein